MIPQANRIEPRSRSRARSMRCWPPRRSAAGRAGRGRRPRARARGAGRARPRRRSGAALGLPAPRHRQHRRRGHDPAQAGPARQRRVRADGAAYDVGASILERVPFLAGVAREVALRHHERWDGQGYPDGPAAGRDPARSADLRDRRRLRRDDPGAAVPGAADSRRRALAGSERRARPVRPALVRAFVLLADELLAEAAAVSSPSPPRRGTRACARR